MKLLYTLSGQQLEAIKLAPGEEPMYCVPVDLEFDSRKMQAGEDRKSTRLNSSHIH